MKKFFIFLLIFSRPLISDILWTPPTNISNTGVDASTPCLVVDTNKNVTAIWLEAGSIKARTLPSGGSWGSISTLSVSSSSNPQVGISSSGDIVALWMESSVVSTANLPFGGSWSSANAISSSGASQARLSVNSAGDAVAVWERSGFIEASTLPSGGAWSLVSQISSNGSESNPDTAIDPNGNIIAVWKTSPGGIDQISSIRGSIVGSWNSGMDLLSQPSAELRQGYPKVAIDTQGNAEAIWFQYMQSGSVYSFIEVQTASLDAGGSSWNLNSIFYPPGLNINPANLIAFIGFDGSNNAFALWSTSIDGQSFILLTASKRVNLPWIVNQELSYYNPYSFSANLAVLPSANTLIAFMNFDGSDLEILFTEMDSSSPIPGIYSPIQILSSGTDNGFPCIGACISSNVLNTAAAWMQFDGSNNVIQAAIGSRNVIASPTNLGVSQNVNHFGIFDEYYNTLTWDASTDPEVVYYSIYRNNAFITLVDASTLEFTDHNAVENGSVIYSIVSVNTEFLQSPPASISFP